MTFRFREIPTALGRGDLVLIFAAVLSVSSYVVILPAEHPDAAISATVSKARLEQAAADFLDRHGHSVSGMEVTVALQREKTLLSSVQKDIGRRELISLLQTELGNSIPFYYWRLDFRRATETDRSLAYRVLLTLSAKVWSFEGGSGGADSGASRLRPINRLALQGGLQAAYADSEAVAGLLQRMPDSVLQAGLFFGFPPTSAQSLESFGPQESDLRDLQTRLRLGPAANLRADVASGMARYHLDRSFWASKAFEVDSVWASSEDGGRVARVRMSWTPPRHRQEVRAEVGVSATGVLREIKVAFNPEDEGNEDPIVIVSKIATASVYGILVVLLLVVFFRRLVARLIDARAALLDAAAFGLFFAVFVISDRAFTLEGTSLALWARVLLGLGAMALLGGAVSLVVFLISGATDSLARATWSSKVGSTSLVRQGEFNNVVVGIALLRGVCLGFILLGVASLTLVFFPDAGVTLDTDFLYSKSFLPFAQAATGSASIVYFETTVILLAVGTFAFRFRRRPWMVLLLVTLAAVLAQVQVVEYDNVWISWATAAITGLLLAGVLWQYDGLTCFIGLLVAHMMWTLNEGWLVSGVPSWADTVGGGLVVLILIVVSVAGIASGRSGDEVVEYVPPYISKLALEERIRREIELAHEVQESFLPRRMPSVPGLDIAALCLPAQEVGGDYYDFVELGNDRLGLVIGDVSGKGIQAAFYMTLTKGFLQPLIRQHASPVDVLKHVNDLFCEIVPRGTFISLIYGIIDARKGSFTFARAGHNPLILKRSPVRKPEFIRPAGIGIGLARGASFDDTIEEVDLTLRPGDVLVLYTDGFSEAMNSARDEYGDERLARQVGRIGNGSASEILRAVSDDVHRFIQSAPARHDDMTMVVLKMGQAAPTEEFEQSKGDAVNMSNAMRA